MRPPLLAGLSLCLLALAGAAEAAEATYPSESITPLEQTNAEAALIAQLSMSDGAKSYAVGGRGFNATGPLDYWTRLPASAHCASGAHLSWISPRSLPSERKDFPLSSAF